MSDAEELKEISLDMKKIRKTIIDGISESKEKELERQLVVLQKRKLKLLRRS